MEAPVDSKSTDSLDHHEESTKTPHRVGIVYDERMCKHFTPDGDHHPEQPDRIRSIWNKLQSAGVTQRCVVMNAKEAEDKYLLSVHSNRHVDLIKKISSKKFNSRRNRIASKYNSIYFNEGSTESAYLAAGAVLQAAEKVAEGELDSAVAIVRPPGHHAEYDAAMGFCLFNNVAVAASFLLNEKPDLGIRKILIVDWDVHHGNGTQKMFWKDPRVLFFSVHRHEFGCFYPSGDDGSYTMIGEGPGAGYNINVPWENGRCGDADYFAVWDHILLPVAKEFNPDMILVSAGFDAAVGDPLGGCRVTPYGYSVMLKQLLDFAQGKIMLVLEGGYNLYSIANSMLACLEVLLDGKPIDGTSEAYPFESTWRVIQQVRQELQAFWPILDDELPKALLGLKAPLLKNILISSSDSEIEEEKSVPVNLENVLQGVIEPLSTLNISEDCHAGLGKSTTTSSRWRSELSQVYVWYAAYGSNIWKPRFLCYIEGGQVEGMHTPCSGSVDRTSPKEILWKTVPFHLFFGRDSCNSWGAGAVAFLNPEMKTMEKTHVCLYKITLEQFNDILIQENELAWNVDCPLFDVGALNSIANKEFNSQEVIKGAWYGDILYLGKEGDVPILTITCGAHDIQRYKNGELPLGSPSEAYANAIIRGLVEGKVISEAEAIAYVEEAAARSLTAKSIFTSRQGEVSGES